MRGVAEGAGRRRLSASQGERPGGTQPLTRQSQTSSSGPGEKKRPWVRNARATRPVIWTQGVSTFECALIRAHGSNPGLCPWERS